ncbi:hypothetical protein FYK55_17130 [Roseiconus nitratireducens]|uniref:Uncharacterized protein n=1 Tax=Roseiconus nitratireducens TaxID=2605748 RepID=A0A5M6D7T0_9BACT|nr:hypothetical protein [Roseiconus nitratireducens]KAA5541919.1 hypothetical protein FYK55_17130 [Roseiconus nitratireducens]
MIWQTPQAAVDELQIQFGQQIAYGESNGLVRFPDLRRDSDLVLAADYSGDHQSSGYQLLTFLLADRPGVLSEWESERISIRNKYLDDGRRHAFKSLNDAQRQKALVPFLKASSRINGVLLCVAIDKEMAASNLGYSVGDPSAFKPRVLAKLTQVALFGSLLVSGLATTGQNLMWLTDEDEIVSNEQSQIEAGNVIGCLLDRMCPFGMPKIQLGIAGKFDDGRRAEDLCAIPDLVGGAVAECLTSIDKLGIPRSTNIVTPTLKRQKMKTNIIHSWFSTLDGPLSGMLCLVRPHESGVLLSFANPGLTLGDAGVARLWLPPDKSDEKWQRSSKAW